MNLSNVKSKSDADKKVQNYKKDLEMQNSISSIIEKETNKNTIDYIEPNQPKDNRQKSYAEYAEDLELAKNALKEKLRTIFKNGSDINAVMSRLSKSNIMFLLNFWSILYNKHLNGLQFMTPDLFMFLFNKFNKEYNFVDANFQAEEKKEDDENIDSLPLQMNRPIPYRPKGMPSMDRSGIPPIAYPGTPMMDRSGRPMMDRSGMPITDPSIYQSRTGRPSVDVKGEAPMVDVEMEEPMDEDMEGMFDYEGRELFMQLEEVKK